MTNITEVTNGNVIRVDDYTYIGTPKDLVSMLIEFAGDESGEVFEMNNGFEDNDTTHLEIAQNYISKACQLMDWLDGKALDQVIMIDIGEDVSSVLDDIRTVGRG